MLNQKKIPLEQSRAAVYSRIALYFFSAGMMGKALAGLSIGEVTENIGNLGLALIFAGMCFRSKEFAVLAYISNDEKRENALRKLRDLEHKNQPWVGWIVRLGWLLLVFGVGAELSNLI